MAGYQESFSKKEKEKKRLKKRQDKQLRKEQRKANSKGGDFENMIAYVDEYGNVTDTPPDPSKRKEIDVESVEIGVPKREKEDKVFEKKGKVAFFDDSKGYGFINDTDSKEKYFVHVNGLLEPIKENDLVTYELEKGMKGMNAIKVRKI